MLVIKDTLVLDILINKKPLPQSNGCFQSMYLTEGNGFPAPAIELNLFDRAGYLIHELALSEGNEIAVMVGKSENDPNLFYRQYRYFTSKQEITPNGPMLKVIGIYDAPLFFTSSQREAFEGTTSQVMKKVAEKSRLKYTGPEDFNGKQTSDFQVWRNVAKSRASFMRQLFMHGYINPGSCMNAVVTSKGELKYRDLNDLVNTDKKLIKNLFWLNKVAVEEDKKKIQVRESIDRSEAGLSNSWMNYGHKRVSTSLSGTDNLNEKISLPSQSLSVAINKNVSNAIKSARVDYSKLDCGNTHKNFETAKYQNLRLNSLFNQKLSILVDDVSNVELFEPVIYHQEDDDGRESKNNGIYYTNGKTIAVTDGSNYCERIELCRYESRIQDGNLKTSEDKKETQPQDSLYVNVDPATVKKVNDTARKATDTISSLISSINYLKLQGPTLIKQTAMAACGTLIKEGSKYAVENLSHLGGSGDFSIDKFQNSLKELNKVYTENINKFLPLSKDLAKLASTLGLSSAASKLSALNRLPMSVEQLGVAMVANKIQDNATRRAIGALANNVGLFRTNGLKGVMQGATPHLPGYPHIPSIPGTGDILKGFPGQGFPDFRKIAGTNNPGLPPLPSTGIFKGDASLPSLPLPDSTQKELTDFSTNSSTFSSLLDKCTNSLCELTGTTSVAKNRLSSDINETVASFKLGKSEITPDVSVVNDSNVDTKFIKMKKEIIESSLDLGNIQQTIGEWA